MSAAEVTVVCCQLAPRLGERDVNLAAVDGAVRSAAAAGARVVVLPELVSSGYVFDDVEELRSVAEAVPGGPTCRLLIALARELGIVVVAGLPERADGLLHNVAVLVDAGGVRATYRKVHLWDRESDLFTAGDRPAPVVQTDVGRIGLMVCYDLEFPEWVRNVALAGAELVCAPTNWPATPRPSGERPVEVVTVQAGAAANRVFLAVCDRVGAERGVDWVGGSAVVGPDGYPIALATGAGEQLVVGTCDLAAARDKTTGARNDVHHDRRPELYTST